MRTVLAISRRELEQYFATPLGWIFLCGFLLLTGFLFAFFTTDYAAQATQAAFNPYMADQYNLNDWLVVPFFDSVAFILLLLCPALTMRLFAEDRRNRSFELLLSSPVASWQIVLGKYLGAIGFLVVLMAGTLHYSFLLRWLGQPDPGIMAANYLLLFLQGAAFLALGTVASALTDSQLVALVLGFAALLMLWVLSSVQYISPGGWGEALSQLSMMAHKDQLAKGLLHLEDIAYYLSFIGFFLFATWQRVEAWRWQ